MNPNPSIFLLTFIFVLQFVFTRISNKSLFGCFWSNSETDGLLGRNKWWLILPLLVLCLSGIAYALDYTNPMHYWKLNASDITDYVDSGGDKTFEDWAASAPNGTGFNPLGIKNRYFSANNQHFNTSLDPDIPFSFSFWMNSTAYTGTIGGHYVPTATQYDWFVINPQNSVYRIWYQNAASCGGATSVITIVPKTRSNRWLHIVLVFNSTGVTSFLNGTQYNQTYTGFCSGTQSAPSDVHFGAIDANNPTTIFDEIAYYNFSLTPADVSSLWNAGAGSFYPFSGGVTNTTLTIQTNTTFLNSTSSHSFLMWANVTNASDITQTRVYNTTGNCVNVWNTSNSAFGSAYNCSGIGLATGNFSISFWDANGNYNSSTNTSNTIPDNLGTVTLNSPAAGYKDHLNLTGNYTWTDPDLDAANCTAMVNGTIKATGNSVASGLTMTFTTTDINVDGDYSWMVNCSYGVLGSNRSSASRVFTLDTVAPTIYNYAPASDNSTRTSLNFTINYSASDPNNWGYQWWANYSNGTLIANDTITGLTPPTFNVSAKINISVNYTGYILITECALDSHSVKVWDETPQISFNTSTQSVSILLDYSRINLSFRNSTNKNFRIVGFTYNKFTDRLTYKFQIEGGTSARRTYNFRVQTTLPLSVVNDEYQGHLMVGTKYWLDWVNPDMTVTLKRVDAYTYDVQIITSSTNFSFNSVGGNNEACLYLKYYFRNDPPIYRGTYINDTNPHFGDRVQFSAWLGSTDNISSYQLLSNISGSFLNIGARIYLNNETIYATEDVNVTLPFLGKFCGSFSYNDSINNRVATLLNCTTVNNTVPVGILANITATAYPVISSANLTGWCNASDVDGQTLNYNFTWYYNDVKNVTGVSDYGSDLVNVSAFSDLTYGGAYKFECIPFDSLLAGSVVNSSAIYVENATVQICAYSGSGNYAINCSLSCNITTRVDMRKNNVTLFSSGDVRIYSGSDTQMCYQESANASTIGDGTCNLDYTGTYAGSTGTIKNLDWVDGDWSTKGTISDTVYVNYTKPANSNHGTIWSVKSVGIGEPVVNYTIPLACWNFNANLLMLRLKSDSSPGDYFNCYNSTDWLEVASGDGYALYEEGIWWNISMQVGRIYNFTKFRVTTGCRVHTLAGGQVGG